MKPLTVLLLCLALIPPFAAAQGPDASSPNPLPTNNLTVFLQGDSAAELSRLVQAQGGRVTHDLHLIDAVGAVLTPAQLEKVLRSPSVIRHFDDLAVDGSPENDPEPADDDCGIGGSLELAMTASGIRWKLYNKQPDPARLTNLELKWPAELGEILSIELGSTAIAPELIKRTGPGAARVESDGDTRLPPLPSGAQDLEILFSGRASQALLQRNFDITAHFSESCRAELIPGYEDNHENFYYNLMAGVEALHLNEVTGDGVTVAVIDSGLWEHPELSTDTQGKPRIVARYDAIADISGKEVFDASGHGTHMTSVIAHSGPTSRAGTPTGTFKGVAPDVNLVVVKAFDVAGQGEFLNIVRAVQWVVDNREAYNIRVLNLSFSARPRWNYWLDPINQAVMRAWASGITVVAAAGNEGPGLMTVGSPGNLPFVITVGAVTDSWTPGDRDDDYIPDFSSRGPTPEAHIKPDLVAPGGHITGITRPGSSLTIDHPEYQLSTGEFVMTGSSQAAALVSGVAALLLQLEPDLSPDDIKCKLISSAEPAINGDGLLAYSPFQQGHGAVNAIRAVTLGQRGCGNEGLDIKMELIGAEHSEGPATLDSDGGATLPGLDKMVSPMPAAKGRSDSRKWGVKAHIERAPQPPAQQATPSPDSSPFDWMQLYLQERETIEQLSRQKP